MKRNILITIVILLLLGGGVSLFTKKNEKPVEKKSLTLQPMSKDLNTELRSSLPHDCNGVISSLFQDKKVTAIMFSGGTTSTCAIGSTPGVYVLEDKSGLDGDKAYIYDYVLIYYYDTGSDKHWANTHDKYIYEDEIVEDDNAYPTDESFHKYGKLYKHTFEKNGEYYKYVSTEPAK